MVEIPPIRVGVVGTGVMGAYHTRVAATLPGCELVGIYDLNTARAEQNARQYGARAYASLDALCGDVEAVIVATPTVTHADVATTCLHAGCHVLLEKPIAATPEEAAALTAYSRTVDRVLMIGHVERYNPAVTAALALVNPSDLFACDMHRLSTAPGRDQSVDIIFDLMIHDLDLVLAFTQSTPESVTAMGHCVRHGLIDHVTAQIRFASGATATLTASAVSQERMRKAHLMAPDVQYTIDCAGRQLAIHRQVAPITTAAGAQYTRASQVDHILVPNREPLAVEQEHFLQSIRNGTPPLTSAEAGLQALQLASSIQACVNEQLVISA